MSTGDEFLQDGDAISADDVILIELRTAGVSQQDIAERLGIGRRAVAHRLSRPEIRRALRQLASDMLDERRAKIRSMLDKAIAVTVDLLDSEREEIRLQAAERIIKLNLHIDQIDIMSHLEELERQQKCLENRLIHSSDED